MTSETNEWYTPKDFYDKLNKEFNFNLKKHAMSAEKTPQELFTEMVNDFNKKNVGRFNRLHVGAWCKGALPTFRGGYIKKS